MSQVRENSAYSLNEAEVTLLLSASPDPYSSCRGKNHDINISKAPIVMFSGLPY